MSIKRFVLEGEWSGYTSAQQSVRHRVIVKSNRPKFIEWLRKTHGILYTDGTMLYLSVREAKPREKVVIVNSYTSLIEDCFHYGVTSVAALCEIRDAAKVGAK